MAASNKGRFDLASAIEKLSHPHEGIRLGALGEILAAGVGAEALSEVSGCLADASERVRRATVTVLAELGAPAITALATALDARQPCAIRILASSGLARWGASSAPAISGLIACLATEDHDLLQMAALALGKIGAAAVPHLRQLLRASQSPARIAAAQALSYAGASASEALDDLRQIVRSEAPLLLRLACAAAACKVGGNSDTDLPLLVEVLHTGDESVRGDVLAKLGECGNGADGAVPAILLYLGDKSPKVRADAALALARIGRKSPDVISGLVRLPADADAIVRLNAAIALSALGRDTPEALKALKLLKQDRDSRVAAAASAAIDRLEGKAS
jgi:HEAT repeat protein